MKFVKLPLKGAYVITPEPIVDARGSFARVFCAKEFAEHGLDYQCVQSNQSLSTEEGTLRGLHFQESPKHETKVVRCLQGAIYDVILDLRPDSETFGQWHGEELSSENRKIIYVPKGFAHGFYTLAPNSEILYLVSEFYSPELERGVRWNDPQFSIRWPGEPKVISERDAKHPDYARTVLTGETR